jgi:hypothetical protein
MRLTMAISRVLSYVTLRIIGTIQRCCPQPTDVLGTNCDKPFRDPTVYFISVYCTESWEVARGLALADLRSLLLIFALADLAVMASL